MNTVNIEVAELMGAALDWAVAGCIPDGTRAIYFDEDTGEPICYDDWANDQQFSPTIDWDQAGPLLVQHEIGVQPVYQDGVFHCWNARVHSLKYDECGEAIEGSDADSYGPTYLIAAMRCLVRSKMGLALDIPEALAP